MQTTFIVHSLVYRGKTEQENTLNKEILQQPTKKAKHTRTLCSGLKRKKQSHREKDTVMEDIPEYDEENECFITSSSTSVPPPSFPQDEITLFLNQILFRSSTSASSSSLMSHVDKDAQNYLSSASMAAAGFCSSNATLKNVQPLLYQSSTLQHGISAVDSTIGASTSTGGLFSSSGNNSWAKTKCGFVANLPIYVGVSKNETNVHDCESEEGVEALVEEVPAKLVPSKGSSKRSRAAEVHNLSEKRRRRRINEKMKALQNLIPNSNKTDKASMLDEAIEYLKQLQLQVQMLSTRNGLISHPRWFSEGLQLMRMEFGEDNKSKPLNRTSTLPFRQENSLRYASNLPGKFTLKDQPSLPSMSHMINSETSFGLDSSVLAQVRTVQPRRSSEILQHQQTIATQLNTKPMQTAQRREW